ncbi:MAG: biotin--[Paludibacteraceae bacterium]|nr:biotin--[acetyl-CoA-carboxylase] ligase [Paludibacteraceae bacterium]
MFVAECDSTNTLLRQLVAEGNPPAYIYAGYQTAGRGQTGNGWESERGKNLLCSILLPPRKNMFELNIVASIAVQRIVGDAVSIKWPNDIYWQDKKVAGILIENALIGGEVKYSIAGIGLNVNQTEFRSDAPNPVSLRQITGQEYDIDALMERLAEEIDKGLRMSADELWDYYRSHLYRREGWWPFVEREVSVAPTMNATSQERIANSFMARIMDVLPSGELVLEDEKGKERTYHFKQIRYVV